MTETIQQSVQPAPAQPHWLEVRTRLELSEVGNGIWFARDLSRPDHYGMGNNPVEALFDLAEICGWTPDYLPAQV